MRTVAQIDKDINAIHRQMRRLEKIDPISAASWQDAWDKHPDLHAKECALYRERGEAQIVRDDIQAKIAARKQRAADAKARKESSAKFKAQLARERASAEMLAALQMFVAWDDNTHETSPSQQHNLAMKAAREAIAKATGAQQ